MLWICRHNKNVDKNRKIKYKIQCYGHVDLKNLD